MRVHRHRTTGLISLLLVVLGVLIVAGCGSGGSSSDEPPPLSKRRYIERFNVIQEDAPAIFVDVSEATKNPASARPHLVALDALIEDIAALRPPARWADEHEQMLDALRDMSRAIDVLSRAPASNVSVVRTQVQLYTEARARYEAAIRAVNESR